ncbi:MAG: acetate uptake transporter [Asticcacaulis sp.]
MTQSSDSQSAAPALANPAVVGLAGFSMTTLMLQFHNLGLIGIAPVIWLGFIFGGAAQFIAGFHEQKMGNNFGFAAFVGYGAFWMSFCAYVVASTSDNKLFALSDNDLAYYLAAWGLFTTGLWIASFRISKMMWLTFTTLALGFFGLAAVKFGHTELLKPAAYDLIVCAGCAWYMMLNIVFKSVFGRDVLPVGKGWF